jgi:exopolysaccharide biosynthesis WecB/TagA/CpsF family protein
MGEIKCSTHTIAQFVDEIEYLLDHKSAQPRSLLCVNAHIYNLAFKDLALRQSLNNARVVTADGMSIVWMSRLWHARIPERCNMTEAFRAFLRSPRMKPNEAILIGLSQEEAERAAIQVNAQSRHCRVLRSYSGFLTDADYRRIFRQYTSVDFVFLGMSTPRTERVCEMARAICPRAIVWGIGAGTIAIFAGTMLEASPFWRRHGLQWLHRLLSEPARLWRRYLIGNPLFIYRAVKTSLDARRTPMNRRRPTADA